MAAVGLREPVSSDDALARHRVTHLLKAEREIAAIRWIGLALWAAILHYQGYDFGHRAVWAVYGGGLVLAGVVQWLLRGPRTIRASAWLATLGDPLLTVLMCSVTGGLESVFFPFFYFTVLAAAFRFGAGEALLVLGFNGALAALLAWRDAAPLGDLLIALAYICFAAALGAMLAGWAKTNLDLALGRSRALRQAHERARQLLRRFFRLAEDERKRFAGELHDRMGGHLFALQQGLDEAAREAPAGTPPALRLRRLAETARACSADVRRLMNELSPTVLEDFGFCEALGEHVAQLAEHASVAVSLDVEEALCHWRARHEALLFRIAQEALLNARKHAAARAIRVAFRRCPEGVELVIEDDGRGFEPGAGVSGHYGLSMMGERAEAMGGDLEITSAPGAGTRVRVVLPEGEG